MTLLYQPLSRTFGQRDGCLTPNNHHDDTSKRTAHPSHQTSSTSFVPKSTFSDSHEILSPPLSPYQKTCSHDADGVHSHAPTLNGLASKAYMQTGLPFKLEDFKSYLLTVVPWTNLSTNYKQRQLRFLDQYSAISSKEHLYLHLLRLAERRAAQAASASTSRKRTIRSSSDDSDTDAVERIRTRRVVKENLAPLSEIDIELSVPALPSPKKRKVRKESPYAGSPLAVQQAALIDESIPNYSPDPATTLPKGNNRCLKIEWKGQPMDLKNDPNLDKLHPAEVLLASTLRLPCNVYLDSKRRLFYEKVNRMRSGMPFRRTDAQKACRIDVNKASRLFAAFEKVGWLNDSHFTGHI
ncbi:CIC11C00000003984 [Sungouiella intermedia]|uniref:CIC11C00000002161 n=1 Tax=Sungouiella intermedia TaxID=45354 RepID=A0A1L0BKT3_9ASCO|nr:CIC11C00000003984 [[Candida] intermedia]SGZ50794.1 CIC11C00000002161 [[Candida] intermedia]